VKSRLKSMIRGLLSQNSVNNLQRLRNSFRILGKLRTQRSFSQAGDSPAYLDSSALETLQKKYPFPSEYGYDAKSLEDRGLTRAAQILRLPGGREATSFLELGCWDGMVSCILCRKGKNVTAIDSMDEGFDERASREGVTLLQMTATDIQFENESFDFVFSYDSFEHFAQPDRVFQEAIRTVKKGGYIYLEFGPLYMSPFGEHAYRSISVPYCQFLFSKSQINDFANQKGLKPIDFNHVNGWTLEDYRKLWKKYSHMLDTVRYYENKDLSHLDLIRTYPSCFKSKSKTFENFLVSNITVLFRKIAG
jgi:2-polyprenyl-3-methyl-5-hydroxy-6-metoxy-1,4-benzoquinol methylase